MAESGTYKKEDCIRLLCEKQAALAASGDARFPRRADFSDAEVVAIKAFLGPWPRALEAAGLKAPRSTDRAEKNREKRRRAAQRRREAEKAFRAEQRAQAAVSSVPDDRTRHLTELAEKEKDSSAVHRKTANS